MKKSYDTYLISRKFAKGVFTSKEILQIFGYSEKTKIQHVYSNLGRFIKCYSYEHPRMYWYVFDLAAVPKSVVPYCCSIGISIQGPNNNRLYLVNRKFVPFYLLKEHGGKII